MAAQKHEKLNRLQHLLPDGLLADAGWLQAKGYSSALRSRYVSSGWLERPARGVYRRPGGGLQWRQVVQSLQSLMDLPVFVGGRTALKLHGFGHYLSPEGVQEIHLYSATNLPGWVDKLDLNADFIFHNANRLFPEHQVVHASSSVNLGTTPVFAEDDALTESLTHQTWGQSDWALTVSTVERAVLEMLDELPHRETFHQADKIIEGLRTLSPRRLQRLLENCKSIKVKRLFLWFAERHQFRWLNQIDPSRIDIGSGKRMLAEGGRLDPKYLITVPEELDGGF